MALPGSEKAALFLRSISEDTAAEILKNLDDSEISRLTLYMNRLKTIDKSNVEIVFNEAAAKITEGELQSHGTDYVKRILMKVLGPEKAERVLSTIEFQGPVDSIRDVEPTTLANFLVTEHPQTIALALCLLEAERASEVLAALPDALKTDVTMRMANIERIPSNAVEELEEAMKGMEMQKGRGTRVGGTKAVAEILNYADRTTEQMILERIDEQDNELADEIRQLMFVFEDLVTVDDRGIQAILKEVSTDDLALALKTASDALKEKIFKNMSKRAGSILKEEMDVMGPARVSDVERAQQGVVKTARKLEEEGRIILGGKGGEELV